MMREIGSEFSMPELLPAKGGLFPRLWREGDGAGPCFSGGAAIAAVLHELPGKKRALLPAYCCEAMITPFLRAGMSVDFYAVEYDKGFEVTLPEQGGYDVLLWCNYFGYFHRFPVEEIAAFRARGGVVIEDMTHSLLSPEPYHKGVDYAIASVRKWGAVLCGGLAVKCGGTFDDHACVEPDPVFLEGKERAMTLKRAYLTNGDPALKQEYLALFSQSNASFARDCTNVAMDELSLRLLSGWDLDGMRARRVENARVLHAGLLELGVQTLFAERDMLCPCYVPILADGADTRNALRARLTENGIYCPIHWPRPSADCASALYDRELSLICDQRYTKEDMHRILSVLEKR